MTDCPYCERSVLPANGRCPSCQGDLMAEGSERGGWYVIAWGPVVAGAIQFMRAWLRSRRSGDPPAG